jgi:hypothetical protein
VDETFDSRLVVGPDGYGAYTENTPEEENINAMLKQIEAAYLAANPGPIPRNLTPDQLVPYATNLEQQAVLNKVIQQWQSAVKR